MFKSDTFKNEKTDIKYQNSANINNATTESEKNIALGSPSSQPEFGDIDKSKENTNTQLDRSIPPPDGLYSWLVVVAACFCYMNIFGGITVSGILQEYYLNTMFPNTPAATISWINTISFTLGYMGGIFAGPLVSYVGIRYVTLLAAVISTVGLLLASFCSEIWQLVLTQGVIYGFGSSLLINLSVTMATLWLVKHRSLALGIIASGGGFGGLILAPAMRKTLPALGIHWTFRVLAFLNLLSGLFCFAIYKERGPFNPIRRIIDFKLLKRPITIFICLAAFFNQYGMSLIVLYFPATIADIGQTRATAANTALIYSAIGGFGRILANILSKRVGNNNTLLFSSFGSCILIFSMWLPSRNFTVYLIFISFFALLFPMAFPLITALVSNNYKNEEILLANGLMFFFYGLSALCGVPIMGLLFDRLGHRQNFSPVIVSGGIIYFINFSLFLALRYYVKKYDPSLKIGRI
ncbi:putative transporter ESBP6 [Smittium culicis]|uniref:Putative transporter ESBP6 n=2 Tax=Smittium culicis TaxID=133412 RepID=A0A1R1Y7Q6_9FUNG|nr:putative transporter ESBP6 [Smittium culicis]